MYKFLSIIGLSSTLLIACQSGSENIVVEEEVQEPVELLMEKEGITLSTNRLATAFDEAHLHLVAPSTPEDLMEDSVMFRFEVENYELGVNTADPLSGQCANSGSGQHIHFILNNEPYSAHYSAEFKKQLPEGHKVLLAFLSRSYHMSVKNESAFILTELGTEDSTDAFDEKAPHLFYSRPKGTYEAADADKVMLDFYLINTDLQDKSYSVNATINGVSFSIDTWEPYFIEGLVPGENTIKLELLDNEGNLVLSPYNPVERIINVK